MNPILNEQAQEIAVATGTILGRSVLITDTNAIIIGCTNVERVGRFHSPSLPVVAFGKETYDDEKAAQELGVLPGVTLPFTFFGKIVGTIAVSGKPEEVLPFAPLIKKQAEMMLREKLYLQNSYTEDGVLQNLVDRIASFDPLEDSLPSLLSEAANLGFDLSLSRITVVFEIKRFRASLPFGVMPGEKSGHKVPADLLKSEINTQIIKKDILSVIRAVFDSPQDISCILGKDRFVVLASMSRVRRGKNVEGEALVTEMCQQVLERVLQNSIELVAGIGSSSPDILGLPSTYDEAWKALTLGSQIAPDERMFNIVDLQLESMIALSGKKAMSRSLLKKLEDISEKPGGRELLQSYRRWFESFFNLKRTAAHLNIHRNTLSYRIEKLARDTELDLSNFKQALALYLAIVNLNMRR